MIPRQTAQITHCLRLHQRWFHAHYVWTSCRIRSGSQTTGLTLTAGVRWICMKRKGGSSMNIHYDVTGLLSAVWKVTLKSTCLGCLS